MLINHNIMCRCSHPRMWSVLFNRVNLFMMVFCVSKKLRKGDEGGDCDDGDGERAMIMKCGEECDFDLRWFAWFFEGFL
jgi:hypothetical protein